MLRMAISTVRLTTADITGIFFRHLHLVLCDPVSRRTGDGIAHVLPKHVFRFSAASGVARNLPVVLTRSHAFREQPIITLRLLGKRMRKVPLARCCRHLRGFIGPRSKRGMLRRMVVYAGDETIGN